MKRRKNKQKPLEPLPEKNRNETQLNLLVYAHEEHNNYFVEEVEAIEWKEKPPSYGYLRMLAEKNPRYKPVCRYLIIKEYHWMLNIIDLLTFYEYSDKHLKTAIENVVKNRYRLTEYYHTEDGETYLTTETLEEYIKGSIDCSKGAKDLCKQLLKNIEEGKISD